MAITSAIVLFAVTWFMTMLVALPIGLKTQGDMGEKVEGTHFGAPANYNPRRKAVIVTLVSVVIWAILFTAIIKTDLTWHDFDWTSKLPPVGES
ncbi:DUF1467 family protein [Celeribacter marinus]|uniref:DUF1467 family protein n=1 Tax=Celeribacter marinus TaxID=1397108 RepID=UPI00317F65C3